MCAHHRARAFAIDVYVADKEEPLGLFDLCPIMGIDRARQTVLRIIGQFQGMIKMFGLGHSENGAKNFLLEDSRFRSDIRDYSGLKEITLARRGAATGDQPSFVFADLDVTQN